jgi:Zn-dependent M28 family amino/carboxypeptidase
MRQIFYMLLALCLLTSCKSTNKSLQEDDAAQVVAVKFVADSAFAYCQAQCDFGPRTMNSEAHERCAQWIKQKFEQFGCTVELQQADLRGYDGTILKSTNIIAHTKGSVGPAKRDAILICAHWDSRPWADNDPDEANHHTPVLAANDGASGIGVMLELARLFQQYDSLKVDVDFVCFDAEDWGIPQWSNAADDGRSWALGAQYWAADFARRTAQGSQPAHYRYGILLDMVGGQGARFYRELGSLQYARNVVDKVWAAARTAGYGSYFPDEDGGAITDDHVPVNQVALIPCIDIIPYYPDCQQSSFGPTWHTVSDDMNHLDRSTLQAVGQTLVQVLYSEN